jgi:hypothetical protein
MIAAGELRGGGECKTGLRAAVVENEHVVVGHAANHTPATTGNKNEVGN